MGSHENPRGKKLTQPRIIPRRISHSYQTHYIESAHGV